ncbi:hypothetical protein BDV40DRAFT_259270 [Aspergillus tamarii]|uniref:Uncharacterized protein n=1 Tax=Aspergillus tamarii TaxID=41984 RepID=A0A5N6V259_ASPTM|nr:hypothetical protein BDV40DRAFT_259270 [Aspergillus tamarii]
MACRTSLVLRVKYIQQCTFRCGIIGRLVIVSRQLIDMQSYVFFLEKASSWIVISLVTYVVMIVLVRTLHLQFA